MSKDNPEIEQPPVIDFPELTDSMEDSRGEIVALFDSINTPDGQNLTILNEYKIKDK